MRHVGKVFPGVIANDDITLDIRPGRVHCLLGENGAGKSTLISILAGMQQPDTGWIEIDGQKVNISSPRSAMDYGIGVVYQHSTLISTMTVLENLMLGVTGGAFLNRESARSRLTEISAMLGVEIDPDAEAADLALGQQQQVEIAKAMWKGSRVLILDEPTSMLAPQAIADLDASVERLTKDGIAVIFITHKLREAYSMGDEVSVLRRGRLVASIDAETLEGLSEEKFTNAVLAAMFGDDISAIGDRNDVELLSGAKVATKVRTKSSRSDEKLVLHLEDVTTPSTPTEFGVSNVSLKLRAGEVVGVAGIDGHGQSALAEVVAGQVRATSGSVFLDGDDVTKLGVRARQELGLRYVTDDRLHEGIVADLSVALNLLLKQIGKLPYWKRGQISKPDVDAEATRLVEAFEIRTPSIHARAGALSGGNIQKLLLARELSHQPTVVVFNKPTYGLDLKTVNRVRKIVKDFAEQGGAVLLISTDLDELVELSDRVAIISRGRLVGEVENNSPDTARQVGEFMVGSAHSEGNHV
ncbi:MAG: ATP-binding cassette domain-containing protein [Actinobacteria bacterium]|nr:ATP-binding cassette domain-containing protein [Actinomycetota bacterium]